jgi:hypothetical protein
MKKAILALVYFLLISTVLLPQNNFPLVFDKSLQYRGYTVEDLTIPFDTTDQPNTNQCKLILPIVYNLMTNSSGSFDFMDRVMSYKDLSLEDMVLQLFKDVDFYNEFSRTSYQYPSDMNRLGAVLIERVELAREKENKLLGVFSPDELKFLQNNLMIYFVSSDSEDSSMTDIYKLNETQDSAEASAKKLLDLLSKIDRDEIFNTSMDDFIFCNGLYQFLISNKQTLISLFESKDNIYEYNKDGIRVAIGGAGSNFYKGKYDFIIDLGGNDVYEVEGSENLGNNFNCIIDLSGNDLYTTHSNYALGACVFSPGFIFDREGDDTYRATNVSLGAAIGGLALIYDEKGSDIYEGTNFSIGAGMFGAGLVYDNEGNDFYIANTYSQGFGMTEGIGAILDKKGNDSYLISPVTVDINRYNDHYLSMCQGYGFGLRPYYAGGIGYIIEGEGNDVYACDIFGQGGSYWYSLGVITDKSGHDKYTGFHYNQGSGIHFSVGLLKDSEGWDYYSSNWVSQGCGHDYALGVLWDVRGNDLYACDGLSQGAGNANGIGILVDENGRDGYLSKDFNTQGYGAPSRNFGSIGICADGSGTDFYSERGSDSTLSLGSTWGVRLDYNMPELITEVASGDYKVEVDTSKVYSMNDIYLFARTLEARFSKYSQFGFEKMVQDSVNSAQYISSMVGSADIRDVVLIRNLNSRIGYTISNLLISKLSDYLSNKSLYNTDEVGFMCFLIGEAKNKKAKDILLQLTYDEKYRVRSSAINALAKMNFQKEDAEFTNKVSERLAVLANEKSGKKLYNKEIAFALKNFKNEKNIPALINMMSYNYYGVRFLAAEDLKDYGDVYYKYITPAVINEISGNREWVQAFLNSVANLSESDFKEVTGEILNTEKSNDEIITSSVIKMLKDKIDQSKDKKFVKWGKNLIAELNNKIHLKIK